MLVYSGALTIIYVKVVFICIIYAIVQKQGNGEECIHCNTPVDFTCLLQNINS